MRRRGGSILKLRSLAPAVCGAGIEKELQSWWSQHRGDSSSRSGGGGDHAGGPPDGAAQWSSEVLGGVDFAQGVAALRTEAASDSHLQIEPGSGVCRQVARCSCT